MLAVEAPSSNPLVVFYPTRAGNSRLYFGICWGALSSQATLEGGNTAENLAQGMAQLDHAPAGVYRNIFGCAREGLTTCTSSIFLFFIVCDCVSLFVALTNSFLKLSLACVNSCLGRLCVP